ncbi:Hint domain-containing homing endonuclease [Streptomyces sp. 130]|uniref:Hint domain-containing homing endonuclease n=1 Tax=Streptomyces sp. 130 TaxID=2591006 RepID=UPI00163D5FC4|nr:Hint domain-containing homing endonuclease [Streptomyces sp. 130]
MAQKCTQCFLAGTKVLMADGSAKNIESVEVRNQVKATDPVTQDTAPHEVTDLIVTEDENTSQNSRSLRPAAWKR